MARRTDHHATTLASVDRAGAEKVMRKALVDQQAGRLAAAERRYRRVLDTEPHHPEANYKLGIIASQTGRLPLSVPHFAAALKAAPDEPRYWLTLAAALLSAGRLPDARSILQRFADKRFADADTKVTVTALVANLFTDAHQHYLNGRFKESEALIDVIVLLDEGHAEALHIAGNIAVQTNRLELAFDLITLAISLDGTVAGYHANLGNVLSRQKRYGESIDCYRHALELNPLDPLAHSNIGVVLQKQSMLQEALEHTEEALRLAPDFAKGYSNFGVILKDLGRIDDAIGAYDKALILDPSLDFAHSNRLFAKMYATDIQPRDQFADAKAFAERFADPLLRRRPFSNDGSPDRRLRVGFVSGDFCEHAVNYFFEPALRNFDRTAIETFAYSNTVKEDAVTERLKLEFAHWRCLCGLDDDTAANMIEADRIDILVDLSGHTAGNRLLIFARKPAPIQVGWIGYPGTTGMAAMDYRFTDIHIEPDGLGDDLSVETLWRLPRVVACYQAPAVDLPLSDDPPSIHTSDITFGCLNRYTKVTDTALMTWGRILARVPRSKLLLEIADVNDPNIRQQVEDRLQRAGLPLDRVILEARSPQNRYVLYNRIDIAFDPFPYNGGTTSFDALWMGVPFVALEGDHVVSRMGYSTLKVVGLPELCGRTADEYVDIAVALALDAGRLRAVRQDLRGRIDRSPHMDHALLANDVRDAFHGMWRRWVEATSPE